jgi:exopolyphosphatase/guanosine-5'-triphosphate,3'-diphosphate pyrophosphatase
VRESRNGDAFVERVRSEAGVSLQVINGSEEARLVYLAVRNRVPLGHGQWILVDVGGGSVEVSLINGQGLLWSESHTMGAVRLLEELAGSGEDAGRFRRLLEEYVSTLRIPSGARYRSAGSMIATGGNIDAISRLIGTHLSDEGPSTISLTDLGALIERLSSMSYQQRCRDLGLREDRADVILPAAMVYERLAMLAGAKDLIVPRVGIREGVVIDLMDDLSTHGAHQDRQARDLRSGAIQLGRRYLFDESHALQVADLAVSLFDQLIEQHRLGADERRLLLAAAILHDIGQYVSYKGHHKHSLYLISNCELPGLSAVQIRVVANVARYHRKTDPEVRHVAYAGLPEEDRTRVRKLSAILRLADALDRDHLQRVESVRAAAQKGILNLELAGSSDLLLERWALQRKAELFTRVFGLEVRVARGTGNP